LRPRVRQNDEGVGGDADALGVYDDGVGDYRRARFFVTGL
jgi:hypothetical protein